MEPADLLPLLRETAERASLEIRRERGASSGVIKLKGKVVAMMEPGTPPAEECRLLIDALKRVDLGGIFVPPAVRDALDAAP